MAEILESFDFPRKKWLYPTDEWLDGRIWKLTRGADFTGKVGSMDQYLRHAAKRMGVKVLISVRDDSTVIVQAVRPVVRAEP